MYTTYVALYTVFPLSNTILSLYSRYIVMFLMDFTHIDYVVSFSTIALVITIFYIYTSCWTVGSQYTNTAFLHKYHKYQKIIDAHFLLNSSSWLLLKPQNDIKP